jgi:flagellar basal body-associated protein FliL
MFEAPNEKKAPPKWLIILLLVMFIGSAFWGAYVMVQNEAKYGAPKPSDPLEDRSLFGR